MCFDNQTSLEMKCKSMIDCMEAAYPCNAGCQTTCLNTVGGSGVLTACVNALTAAACN
jgi:hypothetical protein